jgi:drug/metabolite transporter (DMT)-like permease
LLPVAAIFGAVTVLGEVPDPMVLAGGMVVIFGVGVVVVEPAYLLAWWRKKNWLG